MRRVVIDTETTGLEYAGADRVIEIACLALEGTQLTGEYWQTYLNPRVRVQPGAFNVHKITDDFLADKPEFSEAVEDLIDFLGNDELIGHNILGFDRHFLNKELRLVGKPPLDNKMIDTLLLARNVRPGKRNSLDALCKDFHIHNTREGVHGALVDADLNARVFAHLVQTAGTVTIDFSPSQEDAPEIEYDGQVVVKATAEELDLHAAMCKELGITSWQLPPKAVAPHLQAVK
jgi:DNA polymerase-3 subunit epsilon